ncbi:MAG TPA: glycosyltransferase family 9 protein [Jatrophihabitans sp.]|nr:glycosyltransferase family 9 protein [Jatrophihabitans sp.]
MKPHVLVARMDSLGDVLVCGPAIRAVAHGARLVSVLAGPLGAPAARLLPGVDDVISWPCPWIAADPPAVEPREINQLVNRLAAARVDEAIILTSFHQSALPTALLLRMAGVDRITAISEDYPGSLLDVRVQPPGDAPEPERMLAVARAAGYELPPGDDGLLALTEHLPPPAGLPHSPYVVVHPGAAAPARTYPEARWCELVALLTGQGRHVLITGSHGEAPLTARVAGAAVPPGHARDCGGLFDVPALAAALRGASVVVAGNTGPAHLAAAVGTPVVSLFAPVVPAARWAPYGVAVALLGDQLADCRDSRARECPVAGHPCLSSVSPAAVAAAIDEVGAECEAVPA